MWSRCTNVIKGYHVTTWCTPLPHGRYEAMFTVFPPLGSMVFWEHLPKTAFETLERARSDAFVWAERFIEREQSSLSRKARVQPLV
jgi:hypothetical protein